MKNISLRKKVLVGLSAITTAIAVSSCNMEERRIKNALEDAVNENHQKYELIEYHLVESITKDNIKDSITRLDFDIEFQRDLMKNDSIRLLENQREKRNAQLMQANTLWHLKSSYNSVISSWDELIEGNEEKIAERQEKINGYKELQNKLQTILDNTEEEIVYYIFSHSYKLDGKVFETETYLTSDYKPYNRE